MEKDKFIALVDKYLAGTATGEEMSLLLEHYSLLEEKFPEWDAGLMGDQLTVKSRLFNKISEQIKPAGLQRHIWWRNWQLSAAVVLFFIGIGISLFFYQNSRITNPVSAGKMMEVVSGTEMTKHVILQDGTQIWLNKGSKISYPETFADSARIVSLSGEGYFEVAHNQNHPFIITTELLETRVLGTRFVINAFADNPEMKVTVVDGKVKVSHKNGLFKLVTGHQQVIYDLENQTITKQNIDELSNLLAWTGKKITYRNVRLEEVAVDLSQIFSIKINVDKRLKDCLIHADFLYSDSPGQILDFLAASLNGKVITKAKGRYQLTGKGCN